MIHKVYEADVTPGEVCVSDMQPLLAFRVKTPGGKYAHILADSQDAVDAWIAEETARYDASVAPVKGI